jgi:uncharacterized phiE125 gp8 family phage protein
MMYWGADYYGWSQYLRQLNLQQQAALQQYGLATVTPVDPADEPLTLAAAYAHLRIDFDSSGSADDPWLLTFIPAAREYCERYLGRALAPRTLELVSHAFPTVAVSSPPGPVVELPYGPVQSIESITYQTQETVVDSNGDPLLDSSGNPTTAIVTNTLDPDQYALDRYVSPARVILAHGATWPTALAATNAVRIRYVTGYLATADSTGLPVLPLMALAAELLLLGHWFANREGVASDKLAEVPLAVHDLLSLTESRERLGMA